MLLQTIQFEILKLPWKNAKNCKKNTEIACPVNFWNKKNVPDVCHRIFWFYRKTIIAPTSCHKKKFFLEVSRKNFMTKSNRGGDAFYLVCSPPPIGVQNYDFDGFDVVWMSVFFGYQITQFSGVNFLSTVRKFQIFFKFSKIFIFLNTSNVSLFEKISAVTHLS